MVSVKKKPGRTNSNKVGLESKNSECRYRELFDNIGSCVAVYRAVDEGQNFIITDFNRAAEKVEKIPKSQVEGRLVTDVFPGITQFGLLDVLRRVSKTGIPEKFPLARYEDKRVVGWKENNVYKLPTGEIVAVYEDVTEVKEKQRRLEESENKFRALFENGYDAILLTSPDGRIIAANPSACKMLGRSEQEICQTGRSGILAQDNPNLKELLEERSHTGRAKGELKYRRKDGTTLIGEMSSVVYSDHHGEDRTSVIIRDVSDRVKSQEELKASEERFRVLVDTCPDGIVTISEDGLIEYASEKALELFGNPLPQEVIGSPMMKWVAEESREQISFNFKNTLAFQKMSRNEYLMRRCDGQKFWVETNSSVIKNQQAHPIGLMAIIRDISERKKMELSIGTERENFKNSLDTSPFCAQIITFEGQLLYVNQTMLDLWGYKSLDDLLSTPIEQRFSSESIALAHKLNERRKLGLVPSGYEVTLITRSGNARILRAYSKEIYWNGQRSIQIHYEDITERKKAQDELLQKALLLDNTSDSILVYDLEGNILYANQTFLKEQNVDSSEADHLRKIDNFVSVSQDFKTRINRIREKGDITFETERLYQNGEKRNFEIRARLVKMGKKDVIMSISRDISERKQSEESLKIRERQYRELAESISDVFFAMDREFRFTYWNHASEVFSGISSSHALGKNFSDIVSDTPDRNYMLKIYQQAIETGVMRRFMMRFPEKKVIQDITAYPTKEGISIFAKDITAEVEAHERLEESEERLRILFVDAPDAYCLYDLDGIFIDGNRAAENLSGYKKGELIGRSLLEVGLIRSDEIRKTILLLEKNKKGEATGPDEFHLVRKDGAEIFSEISTFPTKIRNNSLVLTITRDITERKRMEENLLVTDRLASIGELASGMAHELNNPLTSVVGFADLLLEKTLPDDIRESVEFMCREAKRTSEIVRNMLIFARKHPAIKQTISVNEIITKVLDIRSYDHKLNSVKIIRHLDANLPLINGDYFQLQQVFLNIVINAEYFMKETQIGGVLTVISELRDSKVIISITDNGPGISQENLKRIFDPFFTTKPVGKGTGLGLSICYGIISEHGGHIYAESTPGHGATFYVELPVG